MRTIIYFKQGDDVRVFYPNPKKPLVDQIKKAVPEGVAYDEGLENVLPERKTRSYWFIDEGIKVDTEKQAVDDQALADEADQASNTIENRDFVSRFSEDEIVAIYLKAEDVPQIKIWLDDLRGGTVWLDHPTLLQGMAYFAYEGIVSSDRHDIILKKGSNNGPG